MNWNKAKVILAILIIIIPAGYTAYAFVDDTLTHIAVVDRRHLYEDLKGKQDRLWTLKDRYKTNPSDSLRQEIIDLQNQVDELKRKLGLIAKG